MALVILQSDFARRYTGGQTQIEVNASDYRALVAELERRYPGLAEQLSLGMAVAIDGEIFQTPLLEAVGPDSEVHFLPVIGGG